MLSINGAEVSGDVHGAVDLISLSDTPEVLVEIYREGEILEYEVDFTLITTYELGINFAAVENGILTNMYYGFWDTAGFIGEIINGLVSLFTGNVGTESLMGPIGVSVIVARTGGIIDFIVMMALISLAVGVTNLMPFPPLDGGKIAIYLVEVVRRKPMKEELELRIQMIGFCIMIGLAIYVSFNDVMRIF